jgi:hypothetical protein
MWEVTTMTKTGSLDRWERTVRFVLGLALLLIGWDYGWTVIGTGAVVFAVVVLVTAIVGRSPADRAFARLAKQ